MPLFPAPKFHSSSEDLILQIHKRKNNLIYDQPRQHPWDSSRDSWQRIMADLHVVELCVGNTRKYIYFTYSATDTAFNVL